MSPLKSALLALLLLAAPTAASAQSYGSYKEAYQDLSAKAESESRAAFAELEAVDQTDQTPGAVCPHLNAALIHFHNANDYFVQMIHYARDNGDEDVQQGAVKLQNRIADFIDEVNPVYVSKCQAFIP